MKINFNLIFINIIYYSHQGPPENNFEPCSRCSSKILLGGPDPPGYAPDSHTGAYPEIFRDGGYNFFVSMGNFRGSFGIFSQKTLAN